MGNKSSTTHLAPVKEAPLRKTHDTPTGMLQRDLKVTKRRIMSNNRLTENKNIAN